MKHFTETRQCLNCKKQFVIEIHKQRQGIRRKEFCDDCNAVLTNNQKRKIKAEIYPEYKEKLLEQKRAEVRKHKVKYMLNRVKRKSLKLGYDFNLDLEDIVIPDICPILEVPLEMGNKDNYEYSPSIDRIDNSKGYVKGNIRIISKKANSMKNCATYEELEKFCKNVLRYSLNNDEKEIIESENKESQS